MIENIIYLLLAILGLGFLIFIHELGHLIVAKREGMNVEAFSIGFGKPLYVWEYKGVRWQLGWLPFGGYVRIAGMEKKGGLEPYQIPDGFYGKTPWQRIKVALAGPFVNILFAFVAFVCIWISGGQEKPFATYTDILGSVDPQSKLYSQGIRPGDKITAVDGNLVQGFQELLLQFLLNEKASHLTGEQINYLTGETKPFTFTLNPNLKGLDKFVALGISPAGYLVFEGLTAPGAPLEKSGIQKQDRLVWASGVNLFSKEQLTQTLNEPITLLSVQRGSQTFITRIPRLKVSDIRLDATQKAELDDWHYAAHLPAKVSQLYFIPYNVTNGCVVENGLAYIDKNAEEKKSADFSSNPLSLRAGDRILAVDGTAVKTGLDLLLQLQTRKALLIVDRTPPSPPPLWKEADHQFISTFPSKAIAELSSSLAGGTPLAQVGSVHLLPPVTLTPFSELPLNHEMKAQLDTLYAARKKELEKIENGEDRAKALTLLEESQKKLMLGAILEDKLVSYNPTPFALFTDVLQQTWKTLVNLFAGEVNPKHLSGPVGIVQALQYSWQSGVKDALYWLGFVSLNLAILNLLPIPVLDGGHILFSVIEKITKKPIKSKTMERLIIPFVILLVLFFIYVTYQDLARIFGRFFSRF